MLPRLRFVVAAIVIAVLPMVLFSTSPFLGSQGSPDALRPSSRLGTVDSREAQQLHVLAYGRRADELSRLREMGSAPLAVWTAAPAGEKAPDHAQEQAEPVSATVAVIPGPLEPAPSVVALPVATAEQEPVPVVGQEAEASGDRSPGEIAANAPTIVATIEDPSSPATVATIGRLPPQFMPPLPKGRPKLKPVRRAGVAAARTPAPVDPVPFGGLFGPFTPTDPKPVSR